MRNPWSQELISIYPYLLLSRGVEGIHWLAEPAHYTGTSYPTRFDILCLTVSRCVSPSPLSLAHRNINAMRNDVL